MLSFANLAAVKSTYNVSKSALYLGALLLTLLLPACGGGGGDTPVDDGTGDVPIDSPSGGDSISNPATLAIETTYNDSITAAGLRYYKFTTDSSRAFVYEIDLLNLSSSYYWKLYTDSSFTSLLDSCYQSSDTSDCNTDKELDANTTYYLSLQEASGSNDNFTLRIRRILSSEGSLDAPVNLTVGTAYQGTLGPKLYSSRVKSYYKFTSNITDSAHTISLSGATTDIKWELYKGDWNTPVRDCDAIWDAADESCTTAVLTGSTDYYLIVETQGPESTSVTINVTEGGTDNVITSDEGTVAAPIPLTLEQAHTGSVSPDGTSYYKFTTGDVVASHLIKIEHKSTDIDLRLYSDSAFSNEVDDYQGYFGYNAFSDISWRTVALDPNATFYMKVTDSVYGGGLGDEYKVTVFADAVRDPDSEGTTITPIDLTPGVQYIGGTVGSLSSSYYKFTLPEAKPYKISMTNTSDADLSWSLRYDWDDLNTIIYCNGTYGIGDEICTGYTLDAGTTLFLSVGNYDMAEVAGTFDLLVEIIEGEGEGTPTTPVALTKDTPYASSIASSGYSYYEFTTGPEKMIYRISVTGAISDTEWRAYPYGGTPNTNDNTCNRYYTGDGTTGSVDEICDTSLLLPDTRYTVRVQEKDDVRTDIAVLVDSGLAITNLALDTTLNDSVDGYANKGYYKFTTDAVNTDYTISVSEDLSNNLNSVTWGLYPDDTYDDLVYATAISFCSQPATGTQNISCTVTGLTANTTYYLKTNTSYTAGVSDTYDIIVSTDSFGEGSVDSPVALALNTPHVGTVASKASSYYQFTTVSSGPSSPYSIDYDGNATTYIRLYDDALFSNEIDYCYTTNGSFTGCSTIALATGTTYYLKVTDEGGYSGSFTLNIY